MKVIDLFNTKEKIYSFEFFPPKTEKSMANLINSVEELKPYSSSYVSITYGAGGSTRDQTIELVSTMKEKFNLEPMAHLTCVGSSKDYIRKILDGYAEKGIENILALRGDPPEGDTEFKVHPDGFKYAYELVGEIKKNYDFCVGVAGYPEKHVECETIEEDINHLKLKVDSGADFIVTQMFFDNKSFFDFVKLADEAGIKVPIIPGIMPITNYNLIKKITGLCGAKIPDNLQSELDKIKDDMEGIEMYGTEYAMKQCKDLVVNGVPGIHFYTLNKSKATISILKGLK